MPAIQLTLACGDYDRTRALCEGSVVPDGVALTSLRLPVEEVFYRMARHGEFDIAEFSLSSYLLTLDESARGRFVAIPIFPSRCFRHSGIYVNSKAGIDRPDQLAGRVVGIPEYQVTAAVWIRGILADEYGVAVDSVKYRTGGLHDPGRTEKITLNLPASISVTPIDSDQTLNQMLVDGEIDALYSPRAPRSLTQSPDKVRRLFEDPRSEEKSYFSATGVFPIMHTVVIRREVYEQYPWVARSLQKAFELSRLEAMRAIDDITALRFSLPWLVDEVEATRSVMGQDYWTYGIDEANRKTIELLARYSYDQGLARRPYSSEELFAPETLTSVLV